MKNQLSFTRNQKLGVVSMAIAIVLLTIILNVNFHKSLGPNPDIDRSSLTYLNLADPTDQSQSNIVETNQPNSAPVLKNFDPNKINQKEWQELGFSNKQASAIVKYRDNFGPFKSPEDVKKIYVVSEEKYTELKPFMKFETDNDELQVIDPPTLIEINTATKEELESISGIGPVFSDRIIKYRNSLGGFSSKSQFSEVYGLKDESLKSLELNVEIDLDKLKKIEINTATKAEFKAHPYFKDWLVVTAILKERDKKHLNNLDFLLQDGLMDEKQLSNITPYISFNE